MSYTLTLDMPQADIDFVEKQRSAEGVDLARLFVSFLRARAEEEMRDRDGVRREVRLG